MTAATRPRRLLIGIGNPDRGDDAAGRAVAWLLRDAAPAGFEVVELEGEATALLERLEGAGAVFLVDACASGAVPGTIRRFDVAAAPLPPGGFGVSTHGMGLAEAIELARALGRLPPRCIVYAVEGSSFAPGTPLSPAVSAAVATLAAMLREELAAASGE